MAMKIATYLSLLIGLNASLPCKAQSSLPEIENVKSGFETQVTKSLMPLNKIYLERLEALKLDLGARGDVHGGLMVQDEIIRVNLNNGVTAAKPKTVEKPESAIEENSRKEPAELIELRATYEESVAATTDPLKKKYFDYLEALKKKKGGEGNLAAAKLIQDEIDALGYQPQSEIGSEEDRIVIWNTYHGEAADRGTTKFNLVLLKHDKEVWSRKGLRLPWKLGEDTKTSLTLPSLDADAVRIEVTDWVHAGGGLSEVQFFRNGKNIFEKVDVKASAAHGPRFSGNFVVDGITTSKVRQQGYWLLPDKTPGWIEIPIKD